VAQRNSFALKPDRAASDIRGAHNFVMASTTLFVADLPGDMQESDLSDVFRHSRGYLTSRLRTDKSARVVGFVEFESVEDASAAKDMLDGQRVNGSAAPMRMQFAKAHRGPPPSAAPAQKRPRDDDYHAGRAAPPALMHDESRGRHSGYREGDYAYDGPPQRMAPQLHPPMPPGYPPVALYDARAVHMASPKPIGALAPQLPYSATAPPVVELGTLPLPPDASCTLYVENVPVDATQRELSHIFRPYVGFQSLRLIPKEPKRPTDPRRWLCFVEFDNKLHATACRNNVQGYRMDQTDQRGLGCDFAKGKSGPPPQSYAPRPPEPDGAPLQPSQQEQHHHHRRERRSHRDDGEGGRERERGSRSRRRDERSRWGDAESSEQSGDGYHASKGRSGRARRRDSTPPAEREDDDGTGESGQQRDAHSPIAEPEGWADSNGAGVGEHQMDERLEPAADALPFRLDDDEAMQ
jgi:RNA recognition motif-containing protein